MSGNCTNAATDQSRSKSHNQTQALFRLGPECKDTLAGDMHQQLCPHFLHQITLDICLLAAAMPSKGFVAQASARLSANAFILVNTTKTVSLAAACYNRQRTIQMTAAKPFH